MFYDLTQILDRERFKRRCNELYTKGVVVELVEKKPRRTLAQNAYLHLIIGWYAIETGNTIDYVKRQYFKYLCNKNMFVREVEDPYLGKVRIMRSTSDLDTAEMTTAIDRFRNWSASECGIYLPSPEEQAFLQNIEVELNKNRQYL